MYEDVEILINSEIGTILKSSDLTLKLLKTYSKLYLCGAAPGYCEKSIRQYYNQIKIDGMEKINENIKIKQRTCIPSWKGIRYYTALCTHINSDSLHDEDAIKYLLSGILKESDFVKLPEGYTEPKKAVKPENIEEKKQSKKLKDENNR